MQVIKNNQCLKIRVAYDYDVGRMNFVDFINMNYIEDISGKLYAYFPESPRWPESEINGMTEEERQEWRDCLDWDWTRYTLADVSWKEWFELAQEEELLPYRYTATGHSQDDWVYLYLFGMAEDEAESITKAFEQYAYETPCYYSVELIDCTTGNTLAYDSLGGIYDDTSDLKYLKSEMVASINALDGIDEEVKALAVETVNNLDYHDIDNNF
jgi:hypothetical protein